MNFRKTFAVILWCVAGLGLGCATAARAQAGVYGTYSASRLSGIECFAVAPVSCSSGAAAGGTGSVNPSGIQGGIYYDFKTYGPVRLGLDLRGGVARSNKSAVTSGGGKDYTTSDLVLAGARGSFKTRYTFLEPYVEVMAGYNKNNAANATGTIGTGGYQNFVQYEGFAGVDIHVFPFIDLRPVELGIGNMSRIGTGDGTSSVGVKTLAAGIVLHLPTK